MKLYSDTEIVDFLSDMINHDGLSVNALDTDDDGWDLPAEEVTVEIFTCTAQHVEGKTFRSTISKVMNIHKGVANE